MIELLGLLGGAITRLFPTILDMFKQKQDMKYEIQRLDRELALEKARGDNARQEIAAASSAATEAGWSAALVEAMKSTQMPPTGDKWLDRINVSVRPVLTYWWCLLFYTGAKVCIVVAAAKAGVPDIGAFATLILTDFDRGVVASIISFWFVDRALRNSGMK